MLIALKEGLLLPDLIFGNMLLCSWAPDCIPELTEPDQLSLVPSNQGLGNKG